ncbi:MAG: tRNA glutamyl-Q(34) synthetase GluQRS [Deltaproteobacteria bacterium]|nr:MAG: tRNA glutamyl-Q(34) synthetase GluQRS [Deltaproteobacteria bacterium]
MTGHAVVGRLAPTPSGHLHLGNVLAFGAAWLSVRQAGGRLLLRVEDVDIQRASREIEDGQKRDLEWLGITWDREVRRQSERDYTPTLHALHEHTYRCVCTRRQIREAGGIYPGTCRDVGHARGSTRFRLPKGAITFEDRRLGPRRVPLMSLGDPVLRRRDGVFAYPLAVVADDLADGVTEVVRGADLVDVTAAQLAIWRALGARPPSYLHSPLVLGPDGKKLSKSHGSAHVGHWRSRGAEPEQVWRTVLPWLGLPHDHLDQAIRDFDPTAGPLGPIIAETDGSL